MQVFQTHIKPGGKIQLPQQVMEELEFETGKEIELEIEKRSLRVSLSKSERLKMARDLVGKYVSSDISMSRDLIEERRSEAEHD